MKTRHILLPKDYIRYCMTGEYATEVSDASGMLLLDLSKRRWSRELLSALQLDESLLARCYESEEVTGKLTSEAARLLGLTKDCVVVGGAGDCAAGAVGNGIVEHLAAAASAGASFGAGALFWPRLHPGAGAPRARRARQRRGVPRSMQTVLARPRANPRRVAHAR